MKPVEPVASGGGRGGEVPTPGRVVAAPVEVVGALLDVVEGVKGVAVEEVDVVSSRGGTAVERLHGERGGGSCEGGEEAGEVGLVAGFKSVLMKLSR